MTDATTQTENQIRANYEALFHDLAFRSHRAALMMYEEAHKTDKKWESWVLWIPKVVIFIAFLSICFIDLSLTVKVTLVVPGLFVEILMTVFKTFGTAPGIMDVLRKKADVYNNAASNWQLLEAKATGYLVDMNKQSEIAQISKRYLELHHERAAITETVIVSEEIYRKVDTSFVIKDLSDRKKGLIEYMEFKNK